MLRWGQLGGDAGVGDDSASGDAEELKSVRVVANAMLLMLKVWQQYSSDVSSRLD